MVEMPSRRRPAPLAALLAAGAMMLSLLAAPLAGADTGPDVILHAGPHQAVIHAQGPGTFFTSPGKPSLTNIRTGPRVFEQLAQANAMALSPEYRWGAFFEPGFSSVSSPRPDNPATAAVMLLPPAPGARPTLVEHTDQWVALFQAASQLPLPAPGAELLAGVAVGFDQADVLGLLGPPGPGARTPFLASLTTTALTEVATGLPGLAQPVLAVPGAGRQFYLTSQDQLYRMALGAGHQAPAVTRETLPAPAVGLAATRVLSSAGACPDAADLVLLLDNGQVLVLPCQGGSGGVGTPVADALPPGAPPGGRLLAAPAASLDSPHAQFYYVTPAGLWQVEVQPGRLTWRRAVLPPAATAGALQLARLRVDPADPHHPGQWLLVAGQAVLFDSASFKCPTDRSITCDSDTTTTHSPGAWACAAGRAAAPLVSPDFLCAGCADGFYLDRPVDEPPFASPFHVCRPCPQAHCLTCHAGGCLVCADPFLLEFSGPGPSAVCVAACSSGFVPVAGACLPDTLHPARPALGIPRPEPVPGLPAGVTITGFGMTRLSFDPTTGLPIIPAPDYAQPPANVLLFTSDKRTLLMPASDVGLPDKPPPVEVSLFNPLHLIDPIASFLEMGPLLHNGKLMMVHLARRQDTFSSLWLSCPAPGPCTATDPGHMPILSTPADAAFTRLTATAFVTRSRSFATVHELDLPGTMLQSDMLHGFHMAARLPAGPGSAARASPSTGAWHALLDQAGRWSLRPVAMLHADARTAALHGRLLPQKAPFPNAEPVHLPRPGAELHTELVLTGIVDSQWQVLRLPGDMLPAGRSTDLPFGRQTLGPLPLPLGPGALNPYDMRFEALPLPDSRPDYPSALVLLARGFLGVAPLWCPSAPGPGPCTLLPATFTILPSPLPSTMELWQPLARLPGAPGPGLRLLTFAQATGLAVLSLEPACPGGSFSMGFACQACHDTCLACTGPGPAECTGCRFWLPEAPEACLAGCPAGWHESAPGSECLACDASCRTCDRPGACIDCQPGWLRGPTGLCVASCPEGWLECAPSGMCAPCPDACTRCSAAGGPACAAGACLAACPAGQFAASADTCHDCQGHCRACLGRGDFCTACATGLLLAEQGTCAAACPAAFAPVEQPTRVCLACGPGCDGCTAGPDQPGCLPDATGALVCPAIATCDRCAGGRFLLHGTDCVAACPEGHFPDPATSACHACHADCRTCTGPGPAGCPAPSTGPGNTLALGLGLGLGLGLLLLMIGAAATGVWVAKRRAPKSTVDPLEMRVLA
ncbi:hypothetical protein H696_06274 [Fonticula alba]|uniref:Uncharacterized protein n=1 Tax=Fonticula alba TaxID=691883 RepID=A0A058Z196_FONAL|nr:hypothetical protein H696_06274 [Fonticula alba]KCV67307.1 hypothetical protein H696_06274 [Fonticula alba]|eukprot:XP_009498289.1 hypothetical protein H696_06274 [Fonticula alba]